jgi:hypothetical protein
VIVGAKTGEDTRPPSNSFIRATSQLQPGSKDPGFLSGSHLKMGVMLREAKHPYQHSDSQQE